MTLDALAEKIEVAITQKNKIDELLKTKPFVKIDYLKSLVVLLLRQYWFPLEYLLITYADLFEKLSLNDWIDIVKYLADDQLPKYPTALDIFLISTYVMLEIDFIEEYANLKNSNKEYQKDFLEDYIESPGRLHFNEHYQSILHEAGVNKSIFKNIKQNLLKEGAIEAIEIVMPAPDIMYGVQVQHMQFDPPNWSWAKIYKK